MLEIKGQSNASLSFSGNILYSNHISLSAYTFQDKEASYISDAKASRLEPLSCKSFKNQIKLTKSLLSFFAKTHYNMISVIR